MYCQQRHRRTRVHDLTPDRLQRGTMGSFDLPNKQLMWCSSSRIAKSRFNDVN
jgi:hypothetical protein